MSGDNTLSPRAAYFVSPASLRRASTLPALTEALHDQLPVKDPQRRYLIFSSQRTGSTYLCRRLCNVKGRFGMPTEYLHPQAIAALAPRLVPEARSAVRLPLDRYLRAVERARTSDDGWFGIKVQPPQLFAAIGAEPQAMLGFATGFDRVVMMTRRDKLGQAVSGAIALATGEWFNDGSEPALDAARIPELLSSVALYLAQFIQEERQLLDLAGRLPRPPLHIHHEDILEDAQAVWARVIAFLSGEDAAALREGDAAAMPSRPPGHFAQVLRDRFLRCIEGAG